MSQNARVTKLLEDGVAQVSLMRQMECGLSCSGPTGNCESCGMKPSRPILALAANPVGARPGDLVEVESKAGGAIGIALLVYLLPCVALAAGYLVGQFLLHMSEAGALIPALIGLALGFLPARLYNRAVARKEGPEFMILRRLG